VPCGIGGRSKPTNAHASKDTHIGIWHRVNVEPLTSISDAIISVMGAGYAAFKAVRILFGNNLVRSYHKRVVNRLSLDKRSEGE
jgi:hypothetical protein